MARYVTNTGRAISPGRVTRASLSVKRSHSGRPLPMELQCHPKKMAPTSKNPGCFAYQRNLGFYLLHKGRANRTAVPGVYFFSGVGLAHKGEVTLYVQSIDVTYKHNDLVEALGWSLAAKQFGVYVTVFNEERKDGK